MFLRVHSGYTRSKSASIEMAYAIFALYYFKCYQHLKIKGFCMKNGCPF